MSICNSKLSHNNIFFSKQEEDASNEDHDTAKVAKDNWAEVGICLANQCNS